jgi:Tfp pilus assembly protein PilF
MFNDFKQAQFYYLRMLKVNPNNMNLINNYAALMCKLGEHQIADVYFKRLFTLTSGVEALAGLKNAAICARMAGQTNQAQQFAAKILTIDPNSSFAYQLLIDDALTANEHKRAYRLLQRYRVIRNNNLPTSFQNEYAKLSKQFD